MFQRCFRFTASFLTPSCRSLTPAECERALTRTYTTCNAVQWLVWEENIMFFDENTPQKMQIIKFCFVNKLQIWMEF